MPFPPLPQLFYDRPPDVVARDLLGKRLIRKTPQGVAAGTIVEVEAYLGRSDPASHSYRGCTPRNAVMFGPPGRLYVYSIHARWCMNAVTQAEGTPTAVLIRAVQPLMGIDLMQRRRAREKPLDLARGPARLCQAFAVDRADNGADLTSRRSAAGKAIWIADDPEFDLTQIAVGISTRIGVTSAQDAELRFYVRGNRFVSGTWR